jgi:DNA-3-methyladenine glycosylase
MVRVECPMVQIVEASSAIAHSQYALEIEFRQRVQFLRLKISEKIELVPLPKSFYEPSAKIVAPKLLGHFLLRNTPLGPAGGPIVETEAYLTDDPACHGAPGLTPRNRVMFGPPGHGYVYLIYGYHFCVNAVCRPAGVAEAVLVRAIEPAFGEPFMRHQRAVGKIRDLTNGPAKLCEALHIDRGLDGIDLCDPKATLWIAENPNVKDFRKRNGPIITTTRIGITRAAALPLRFYLEGNDYVSKKGVKSLKQSKH